MTAPSARPATRTPPIRTGGPWPVEDRSLIATVLGIPPVAALGLAFGFTALGVFVDLQRIGTVGGVFQALHFTGCVLGVAWVRRRNLFGPVVAPPLLLAVAVPAIALLGDDADTGGGATDTLLTVGAPLVNSFPTMAVTTAVVLALGLTRLVVQREPRAGDDRRRDRGRPARDVGTRKGDAEKAGKAGRGKVSGRSGSDAARGAARRPATPRRS